MKKVLIANRGEIACRVIRSCRELGIATVAIYSEADRHAMHVALADESHLIGPPRPQDSYLSIPAIMAAVEQSGADAVHPGYGFLAENAAFAQKILNAGCTWIGPRPETIVAMGDKERARHLARSANVPVLPGSGRFAPDDLEKIALAAESVGYPLLVKAAGGGGGLVIDADRRLDHIAHAIAELEVGMGRQ